MSLNAVNRGKVISRWKRHPNKATGVTGSSAAAPADRRDDALEVLRRELKEELREVREEAARGRTSFASNTESRAERVKTLRANEDLTPSSDFDDTLQGLQVSWWPVGGKKTFPSADCMEKTTCQNFVSKMLALFQTGKVRVIDGKVGKIVVVRSVPDPQAYQVNNRGPDCLFYDGLNKTGNFAVTLEGEVKRGGKNKFSDDHIGQVTDGLQRLLDLQPERVEMIGLVTDGRRFQFVRIHRRHPSYHFDVSRVYLGETGWQILFGLMAADPEILGYTRISVPGYVVGEFLGKGRFSVVLKGEPVKKKGGNTDESLADSAEEELADSRLLPAGFTQFVVPGDGNCFFHATAHQLRAEGVLDSNNEPFTHELLRALVVSLVDQDPRLRALMSDMEHADLGRVNGWVDHGTIAALANVLNVNVVVYGGYYNAVTFNPNGVGEAAPDHPTLRIIFRGNHYNSVVPYQQPATTLGKRKQEDKKAYELRVRKKKSLPQQRHVVKRDSFPVAIKIFKEEHRKKCDHERKILDRLKALDNVPSVITQVNVRGKPALVISPAGHPVLPEKRGVHTNKTDFAHLVAVLRYAHSLNICHRDVKPQNIFKDDNGRVFLNDWSSAATTGSRVSWEGTPFFYPNHEAKHKPTAKDDLVALVRTVFILSTHDDPRYPARFVWEGSTMTRMEGNLLFRRALECARVLDYDGLMNIFNQL